MANSVWRQNRWKRPTLPPCRLCYVLAVVLVSSAAGFPQRAPHERPAEHDRKTFSRVFRSAENGLLQTSSFRSQIRDGRINLHFCPCFFEMFVCLYRVTADLKWEGYRVAHAPAPRTLRPPQQNTCTNTKRFARLPGSICLLPGDGNTSLPEGASCGNSYVYI